MKLFLLIIIKIYTINALNNSECVNSIINDKNAIGTFVWNALDRTLKILDKIQKSLSEHHTLNYITHNGIQISEIPNSNVRFGTFNNSKKIDYSIGCDKNLSDAKRCTVGNIAKLYDLKKYYHAIIGKSSERYANIPFEVKHIRNGDNNSNVVFYRMHVMDTDYKTYILFQGCEQFRFFTIEYFNFETLQIYVDLSSAVEEQNGLIDCATIQKDSINVTILVASVSREEDMIIRKSFSSLFLCVGLCLLVIIICIGLLFWNFYVHKKKNYFATIIHFSK